jgi:Neuraminidase (sialidase)
MRIIDKGIVFKGQEGTNRQSCAFPGICILPNGRWICTFRAAPQKKPTKGQHVLVTWSDDMGKSWTEPRSPFSPILSNEKFGLFRSAMLTSLGDKKVLAVLCWVDHSNPELPFFNEETEGLLDTRIFLSLSNDNGFNWSEPEKVNTTPFNVPVPITGPILVLQNGELACQFELNKHYYDTIEWRHSSVMMFSKDYGKSWPEYSITSNDPENRIFYWDQRPGVLLDGRILNLFWTFDRKKAEYLNIHARDSTDNGRTWSEMWDTGILGQPAPPISLPDGRIGMVYVDRTSNPKIKMRLSEDGGRTWQQNTELTIYDFQTENQTWNKRTMQDAWSEMEKFSVGLPTTALLDDGSILVVYYSGVHTDLTNIYWSRIG